MLNPKSSNKRISFCSWAIQELANNNATSVFEAGVQLSIITASIWKICERIKTETKEGKQ
jgi:hypothetical protein